MEHLPDDAQSGGDAGRLRPGDRGKIQSRLAWLALPALAAALAVSARGADPSPVSGWLTFAGSGERLGGAASAVTPGVSWYLRAPGTMTTQPLVAQDVPERGQQTVYVATAEGYVHALAANGYVRWRVDLGRLAHPCTQIPDGWGVTGTPVIDAESRALYVADAFGRLHALDLATGRERPGWPVTVYRDFRRELVWGALGLVEGSVYVPTGSYCDQPPMEGKLIRVQIATRRVTAWTSVPESLGGGGSVWGWGGPAYSRRRDSIFVGTGNAFAGGRNTGEAFSEQAGYGVHLVELSRDLEVRASSAPDLGSFQDNGFVGSPVVAEAGCDELVAAQTKSGALFGWRADAIGSGPIWQVALQKADPAAPLLTQPAYSARFASFYVVTWSKLLRVALDAECRPRVAWAVPLGEPTLHGSPTVAGGTVWVPLSGAPGTLLGVDAGTGSVKVRRPLGGVSFTPPTVIGDRLYVGSMHGFARDSFPAVPGKPASRLPEYSSFADPGHGWESREDGVFATENGGRVWRRIHPGYATRVVRTSVRDGMIAVGSPATPCNCTTRRLVTFDGGRSWRRAPALGPDFQGHGRFLYWWREGELHRVVGWPSTASPLRSRLVASVDGSIVDAASTPDGVAALVDRRGRVPQVVIARGDEVTVSTLPDASRETIARTVDVSWPTIVVRGIDTSDAERSPFPPAEWRSRDGGATWLFNRS